MNSQVRSLLARKKKVKRNSQERTAISEWRSGGKSSYEIQVAYRTQKGEDSRGKARGYLPGKTKEREDSNSWG